jgi:hypothetical protein
LYRSGQIEFITTDTIEFVYQGENFESVSCNLCGQDIEIEYWQNEMNNAHEKQFTDLEFITQCWAKTKSLNDLSYTSPAGFSKFIVSIRDAQREIDEKDLNDLQRILSTTLRIVWVHY